MSGRLTRVAPRETVRDRYLVHGTIAPRFVEAHAVTPADAIAFAPAGPREARAFAGMIADGSIRMAAAGRYYFDMAAYEAAAAARRARRVPVLLLLALLIAAVAMVFYRG
ncbi:hypothetical protein [Sphingomonas melonis]|uniref:Uncharacterized protein n=1 Tax=Sphingomonas melonis TaxID=152682 RepID=A0A7Y9FM21_9SPHN|nr:hypothetical protein [Sphingomonas melonis]